MNKVFEPGSDERERLVKNVAKGIADGLTNKRI